LFIGAFFFAMRSCEYVKVQGTQKTKLLTVQNIRFFIGNRQIKHSEPSLSSADCVSITFDHQKRDIKNDVITQHRSGDRILCPVKVWAAIIRHISSYPGSSASDSVNLFHFPDGKKHFFTGTELLKRIRQAATALGPHSLRFTAKEIGLHSARSGAAMAMYLAHVPVFTIMLLGRWSSDAFLRYIRKQVKEFSNGISSKMIQQEHFFTVPSTSMDDLRTLHNPLNLLETNLAPTRSRIFEVVIIPQQATLYNYGQIPVLFYPHSPISSPEMMLGQLLASLLSLQQIEALTCHDGSYAHDLTMG
jgi:hypothetical protein